MDKNTTEAEARVVAELARKGAGYELDSAIREGLAIPVIMGENREVKSLEAFLERPVRIRENAKLTSVGSFIDYVNLHKNASSIILAEESTNSFKVIIDYHDGHPNNLSHKGQLTLAHTTGMSAWIENHKRKMNQEEFGLFIEENSVDIVDPAAATMLQVATSLRAIKSTDFESKVRLDNGAFHFAYKEEIKGTYQDGSAEVPASFYLGVVPYRGMADAYKIEAKLRYRVSQRGLELWYAVPELDRLLERAFEEVKANIAENTGLKVLDGSI